MEPTNTNHLAQHVGLERSTLVRNLCVLEKKGWIEDLAKSQKHQFKLTKKGQELLSAAIPLWEKAQSEFVLQFGQEDASELMRLLQKVQDTKRKNYD